MFKSYLRLTLRKIWNNRLHSIIHVLGLTIGISSCILLFLFIKHELSFDEFYADTDSTYRFTIETQSASGIEHSPIVPYPFGEAISTDLPEIGLFTMIHFQEESLIIIGKDKLEETNIIFADTNFFKVFDYKVLSGDPSKDLARPNAAFLTQSSATKFFGDADPIGKVFSLDNIVDFEVVGLLADSPKNSHLPFEMVVSFLSFTEEFTGGISLDWGTTSNGFCYVRLNENYQDVIEASIFDDFKEKYLPDEDNRVRILGLQPIKDIHFNQTYALHNVSYTIDTSYLFTLAFIGFLILIIACVNFINLASALAMRKSKEIGVRKALGAQKMQIVLQFLGEAFALTLVSVVLSLAIVERILPFFNDFLDKKIPFSLWNDEVLMFFILILLVVVTLLAGLYPSLALARFNAVKVLKTKLSSPDKSSLMIRRGLVIFQFLISQVLIIGTIIVASQMSYFKSKPLGFTTDALVNLSIPLPEKNNIEALRNGLRPISDVGGLTFCIGAPTASSSIGTSFTTPEKNGQEHYNVRIKAVDRAYKDTYGLELLAGRWMNEAEEIQASRAEDDNPSYVFVVNEALIKRLGYATVEEAIGKDIIIGVNDIQGEIIGVMSDFHTKSLRSEIAPVVLLNFPFFYYSAGLRINSNDIPATMAQVEKAWTEVFPDYLFDYSFLDEHIASLYQEETRTYQLVQVFSGLSIFIGCIGLFGLISFIVSQRMKEIGVRKILGASVFSIIFSLAKEFLYLEIIAFFLAVPISYYMINMWLSEFAYRIDLNPLYFISGLIFSLAIALSTVGFQSFKAAIANPVNALKDE